MDEEQLRETLTGDVVDRYPVVNHVARNGNEQADLGATSTGIPIRVDRRYVESDLKVLTGLIEAHFMAGYSGGRKLVAPGLVGVETIEHLHGPGILEHPNATTGVLDGNPLHEAALEIARRAGVDFILNVAMDEDRRVTGVFAGELDRAHRHGVRHVDGMVVASVEEPVDIVVTSSAGYPLDTTFYQAVKGMVGVLDILKEGGSIVIAAGCADGIGSAEFEDLLRKTKDIDAFIHWIQQPGVFTIDQWEIEELVKALKKGKIYFYTDGLSDDDVRDCLVEPVSSVEAGIERALKRHGAGATIAVVPRGPYVIPRVVPGQDAAGRTQPGSAMRPGHRSTRGQKIEPLMTSNQYVHHTPVIHQSAFVAESADLIGAVDIGKDASVWYQVVIRADDEPVTIGEGTNVQDGSVLHIDAGMPTELGKGVTVGHRAIVHGAVVEDHVLISMGAVILSGARIGRHSIIGAGALVLEHMEVPPGSLVVGVPGRVVRSVTDEQIERIHRTAEGYVERRGIYLERRARGSLPDRLILDFSTLILRTPCQASEST